MWIIRVMVLSFFYMTNVSADSSASTGKIIIDGYEMGGSDSAIKGSRVKHTIDRTLSGFSSVKTDGPFEIIYRHGEPSLSISGDKNIIQHVLVQESSGNLDISIKQSFSSYYPLVIKMASKKIESITMEGTSTMTLEDISTGQLTINLIGTVDIVASGRATRLDLNIQGTGDVKARKLKADYVSVNLEGTSDVELTATQALNIDISGVGDILYFGRPKEISKQISGVGDIEAGE